MDDRESPTGADPSRGAPSLQQRLDRLVARARAAIWWERAWPALWWPLGVVLAFLIASWLGLWLDLAPAWRMVGLALFGLALLASLWPMLWVRRPERTAALDRLDRDTGLRHGPARALEDSLALGAADPGSRTLWELHRRRAEAAVARLRVAPPRPDMPRRDRYAVRGAAVVAVVASAFLAGPEAWTRLAAAFDWRAPAAPGPTLRIDGWIDPPLYTRTPPLMIDLAGGEQRLRAPVRSTVVVRVAGKGDVAVTPGAGLAAQPGPENPKPDLREQRFELTGDAELAVRAGLSGVRLRIEAIPDLPPEVSYAAPPETNARGTFTLTYRAKDDYGVVAMEGLVARGEGYSGRRTLVPAPRMPLALPPDNHGEADVRSTVDLSEHPWAGARVKLALVAKDEAGQEGRTETIDFVLPQRPFTKPLAKALVEQRRKIVLDPDDRKPVQTALDALLIEPERFTPQWGVFLGLKLAADRYRRARTDAQLTEVAEWLWTMAVQIEDGDLSDAERELRAAQERLREALERGADQNEIKRLTEELRAAMDRFLREFAERMQREQQQQQAQGEQNQRSPERTITPDDLNRMLNEIEEMMRRGDVAEAQRLLDQLRNILENLQTARPNSRMTDPLTREMDQAMNELDEMIREQQQLRDDTFRQGQQRRMQRQQQGRQQQGQRQQGQRGPQQRGQQGQQGEQGEGQEQADGDQALQQRQQALRDRLQELQRRMRGMGMQPEQGLGEAEESMGEAGQALGQGQEGQAVDAQGRALEGLQRGAQGMAQQMQQMMGDGDGTEQADGQPGPGSPEGRQRAGQRDNDPLGRPTRSRDFSDGRVRVPSVSAAERARQIMEELRRKLGDPTRPREELEYFERLLRPR